MQTAIEAAELLSGLIDEIHVAQGRYTPAEPFSGDSNATFRLASGVAIKGGYAGYSQCSRFAQCAPYARDIRKYETILSGDVNGDDDSGPDNTDENSETVVFAGPTDAAAILDGFTITNARAGYAGGGIHVDRSNPVIRNCTIIDNIADYYGGGIFVGYDSYLAIQNCIIAGNTARYGGGVYCSDRSALTITNSIVTGNKSEYSSGACYFEYSNVVISGCTISGNAAANLADCGRRCDNSLDRGPGIICYSSNVVVSDSILWGNSAPADPEVVLSDWWYDPTTFSISHSVIEGGRDAITLDENCTLDWRAGNIDGDPCFAEVGYWVHIDDPNIPVEPNDPNRAWTGGDYHLKSDHGRWDPNANAWVRDDVTSLCVDAGDPNADWTAELWPHGKQVNMGGYGGTAQASMSPNDVGNIADLDLDGFVYRTDLPLLVNAWLSSDVPLREDLTRDGIVDFPDFAVLALNWERPPLPAQAKILTPLDGAIEVSRTPVLSWISDANAVWHDVYLGTESPPVLQSCVSTTTFEPDVLSRNTQFYWRIDEINPAGITAGQVWNFQTGSSPDRATDPDPPDGMDDEWTMPWYIRWTPGDGAESHDVYFGTTNPPQFQTNQTAATF